MGWFECYFISVLGESRSKWEQPGRGESCHLYPETRALLSVLLVVVFSPGAAQSDVVAIFGDSLGSDCNVPNPPEVGTVLFYVFHYSATGAKGVRFMAPYQACLVETEFFLDLYEFPATVGGSQSGLSVDYGECLTGWIHVLTIVYADYIGFGSPPCCLYPVLPDPSAPSGKIEVTDCHEKVVFGVGVHGIVNSNESCPCGTPTGIIDRASTWGGIKALFR